MRALARVLSLAAAALAAAACPAVEPLPVTEVAPGLYVHVGQVALTTAGNLGDIANAGFVVGLDSVAVIDTGGSHHVGLALREAVRQVTRLPIRYVILSHVHPDHVLGAAAFAAEGAEFVGHRRLPAALARRGGFYLERLHRTLGGPDESRIVVPELLVDDTLELDLGGRELVVRAHPTAHTDTDLSVFDPQTGTLWLSDLLFREHLPVLDGSLAGWLGVLEDLARLPARRVVPGHGPISEDWPAVLAPQRAYLEGLAARVREAIAAGRTLEQTVDGAGEDARGGWALFDAFHRRNLTAAFVELEWE